MWMIACGSVQSTPRLCCVLLSCLFEVVGWDQDQEEEEVDTSYSSNVHTVTQKIYTLQQHQQADCTLMHINGICDYRKEYLDSLKYIGEQSCTNTDPQTNPPEQQVLLVHPGTVHLYIQVH